MNIAIIICLLLTVALIGYGFYTGRTATSDGDYAFVLPWLMALPFGIAAAVLSAIKFF